MSILTTKFSSTCAYNVEVRLARTTLSIEQLQVASALFFVLHTSHQEFTAHGNSIIMNEGEEILEWGDDGTITVTSPDSKPVHILHAERTNGYLILNGAVNYYARDNVPITLTFKDGLLESMDGQPAVDIKPTLPTRRMWFHKNVCSNEADPQ